MFGLAVFCSQLTTIFFYKK